MTRLAGLQPASPTGEPRRLRLPGRDRSHAASGTNDHPITTRMSLTPSESPQRVLRSILESVERTDPDGRPLYGYAANPGTLSRLGVVLRDSLQRGRLSSPEEGAAFCLYAAERFCEQHESGVWKWASVLEELETQRGAPEFYEGIKAGLKWWGRDLLVAGGKNLYLVTLAIEGGLPRSLVKEGSHYRRFLRRVLVEHERFPSMPLRDSANRFAGVLPQTLRSDDVLELSVKLIDWAARSRVGVPPGVDPILFLDQNDPGWRTHAPIRLSTEGAEGLLGGLLRARRDGSENDDLFEVVLELDHEARSVRRTPFCPPTLDAETLQRMLGARDELPTRIQVYLRDDRGQLRHVARASRVGDGSLYAVDGTAGAHHHDLEGELGRLDLVVQGAGGEDLGSTSIPGGEPVDDAPWVFSAPTRGHSVRAIAMGSVKTRRDALHVAVPYGSTWQDPVPERVTELPGDRREVFEIHQSTACRVGDESYRFEVRAEHEVERSYRLVGERITVGFGGTTAWRGCPQVLMDDPDVGARIVNRDELEWRSRAGTWGPMPDQPLGDGCIRHRLDGATRFRTTVSIVPEKFSVQARVGRSSGTGTLLVSGVPSDAVTVQQDEGILVQKQDRGDVLEIEITASAANERTHLELLVLFGAEDGIELSTLIPVRRQTFVQGRVREAVRGGTEVPLSDLIGMSAVAIEPGSSTRFFLEGLGSLFPRQELVALHDRGDGRHELAMDEVYAAVEALIGAQWGADDYVELRICSTGFEALERQAKIRVRRFLHRLDIHRGEPGDEIRIELSTSDPGDIDVRMEMRPMDAPEADPVVLKSGAEGSSWIVGSGELSPGPWLITAWSNARLAARPTLLTIGDTVEEDAPSKLHAAVRLLEEDVDAALDAAIEVLATAGDAEGWGLLDRYLRALQTHPPDTFRAVRRLVANHGATARAMYRCVGHEWDSSAWSALSKLPFLWHLVPESSWRAAADAERIEMESYATKHPHLFDPPALEGSSWMRVRELVQRKAPYLVDVIDLARLRRSRDLKSFQDLSASLEAKIRGGSSTLGHEWNALRIRKQDVSEAGWGNEEFEPIEQAASDPVPEIWRDLPEGSYKKFMTFVREAPARAAFLADRRAETPCTHEHVHQLKRARAFDPDWFDTGFEVVYAVLLKRRLMEFAGG